MPSLKTAADIIKMERAGAVVAQILDGMQVMLVPGVSTGEVDAYAEAKCKEFGVRPVFKGYHGFPACVCISINEEVVHGIPSFKRLVRDGDIVSLDFGVSLDGWVGDSARTIPVGSVSASDLELIAVTKKSLELAIEQCVPGKRTGDIGATVQKYVESFGFGVVREFVGHGIGKALHEEPAVPNFGTVGRGHVLRAGMVIAIEPMVTKGHYAVRVLEDDWTAVTIDGSRAAHWEHTVVITERGPQVLTLSKVLREGRE